MTNTKANYKGRVYDKRTFKDTNGSYAFTISYAGSSITQSFYDCELSADFAADRKAELLFKIA